MSTNMKRHAILGVNTHATYHKYPQRRPIKFNREDLMLLTQMKQAIHDNVGKLQTKCVKFDFLVESVFRIGFQ
jgi:hypothetical protein